MTRMSGVTQIECIIIKAIERNIYIIIILLEKLFTIFDNNNLNKYLYDKFNIIS